MSSDDLAEVCRQYRLEVADDGSVDFRDIEEAIDELDGVEFAAVHEVIDCADKEVDVNHLMAKARGEDSSSGGLVARLRRMVQ